MLRVLNKKWGFICDFSDDNFVFNFFFFSWDICFFVFKRKEKKIVEKNCERWWWNFLNIKDIIEWDDDGGGGKWFGGFCLLNGGKGWLVFWKYLFVR